MIIQIENAYQSWVVDMINNPAYIWEAIGIKANRIWWKVHKRTNHNPSPEVYFVKESNGDYTNVYYKKEVA